MGSSLYLDTSCLLKLLLPEPETRRVVEILGEEEHVVVSSLARLETLGQIHARVLGGTLKRSSAKSLVARMDALLAEAPCELLRAPAEIVDVAESQIRSFPRSGYCPTLDRLHLAVMTALDIHRLLTNDDAQARAARELEFSVSLPR